MKLVVLLLAVIGFCWCLEITPGPVRAGVAKIDGTLPLGTPLAGFNHGDRRVPHWPLPHVREFTTFMMPSTGVMDPTWIKALVIEAGSERVCFVTIDGIGADGTLSQLAYEIAADSGFSVPFSNIVFSASHTHSGPGAISPEILWALAPATDFLVPELQHAIASSMARAMIQAESNLQSAVVGVGSGMLLGVTRNRRAGISPFVNHDSIDPHLGIIRVDTPDGKPMATLWNFACHGTCWGPSNMHFSGDIMGGACELIEEQVGGVALFVNADAGDIDPTNAACSGQPKYAGAQQMATAVASTRKSIETSDSASLAVAAAAVPFGPTNLNATLERFSNCTHGGLLDICTICEVLHCDVNAHLPSNWVENTPVFTAVRFDILGKRSVLVTMPGEPLLELGWWVRNDTAAMGFDTTLLAGYSNSHMGYFATPNEYDIGGYESQLTFWGIDTAERVREGVYSVAKVIAP